MALYLIIYNQGLRPNTNLPKNLYCNKYHKGDVVKAIETTGSPVVSDTIQHDDRYSVIRISNQDLAWSEKYTEEAPGENAPRRRFNIDIDGLNGGQRISRRAKRPFVHDLTMSSNTFERNVTTKPDWSAP